MTNNEQQLIDDVMDTLDFARIARVMKFLEWKWLSPPHDGVPTEYEVRKEVRNKLKYCIEKSNTYKGERFSIGTGGFYYEVWRDKGKDIVDVVSVNFQLCSTDAQVELS